MTTPVTDASLATQLIGNSTVMGRLRALILKVAPTEASVLIQGPTGAGKELVAHALHRASGRTGTFVPFNVCAIPETMFDDALFGHVKGAFTGATADAPGFLTEAHQGTVFLDEINSLAPWAQVKLLRAIETKSFRPLGSRRERESDFRVVTATNADLGALVRDARFRADLAHRLDGFVLDVPPLRERPDDIPLLARHFLERWDGRARYALSDGAVAALEAYDWPGNVRELKKVIERAAVLAPEACITGEVVMGALGRASTVRSLHPAREQHERRLLLEALDAANWKTDQAAFALGVSRATVYRRMGALGIAPPRRRPLSGSGADAATGRPHANAHSHAFAANSHVALRTGENPTGRAAGSCPLPTT